jgi:hypothetical protein
MKSWKRQRVLKTFVLGLAVAAIAAPAAAADPWFTDGTSVIVRPDDRATRVSPPEADAVQSSPSATQAGSFDRPTAPDNRPVHVPPVSTTPADSFDRPTAPDNRPVHVPPVSTTPADSFDRPTAPDNRPVHEAPVDATPTILGEPAVRPDDRAARPGPAATPETIFDRATRPVVVTPDSSAPVTSSEPSAVGDEGFDWTDAGIGAGMALGLVLLACGMLLLLRHRRTPEVAAS